MDGKELKSQLQLFEGRKVRTVWDEEVQEWFFSVVDVVAVLTDSVDPKQYIKKMRARDPELNARWGTICTPTRMMASDGKCYNAQAADLQGMFRIIQSIPSPKAEPFKQWMAQVARDARDNVERRLGRSVISAERAIDHTNPSGSLPLNELGDFGDDEDVL